MRLQLRRMGDTVWPSFAIIGMLLIGSTVLALKLENVSVPTTGLIGSTVNLACDYLLEKPGEALFSLKWYRGSDEFFRFIPGNRESPIVTFAVKGVHVDLGESLKVLHSGVRLKLKNLDFNSSGVYRCEISAETSFQTLHKDKNLTIIALPPNPSPVLSGFPARVQFAEKINGNCTFSSLPAAEISLYLNNAKINSSNGEELLVYKPVKKGNGQIFMSTVGVQFRVAPKYFKFGVLEIKCEATLLDQKFSTKQNITHQNYQPPFYTENRYSSGDGGSSQPGFARILITFFISTWLHFWSTP